LAIALNILKIWALQRKQDVFELFVVNEKI